MYEIFQLHDEANSSYLLAFGSEDILIVTAIKTRNRFHYPLNVLKAGGNQGCRENVSQETMHFV
jgi:hypothetical protein